MIFADHTAGLVLAGIKTQQRVLVDHDGQRAPGQHDDRWITHRTGRRAGTRARVAATPGVQVGHTYAIQRGPGQSSVDARVFVTSIDQEPLGELTDRDATAEGHKTREAFLADWHRRHPPAAIPPRAWAELAHLAACAPHPAVPASARAALGLERRKWATRDVPAGITANHRGRWQLTPAGATAYSAPYFGADLTQLVWVITFELDRGDRVRLLERAAGYGDVGWTDRDGHHGGYTDQADLAMVDEPEAVPPSFYDDFQHAHWRRDAEQRHASVSPVTRRRVA